MGFIIGIIGGVFAFIVAQLLFPLGPIKDYSYSEDSDDY